MGTTILTAIKSAAGSDTKITYSLDGSGGKGAKIGIAVVGETPYAEMFGDRSELRLSSQALGTIARMKADGMRVVLVLISGRPLVIDDVMGYVDAVVAAWLPGSEGDGVADVLFGAHKPSGKLGFSWPKESSTSFHIGDPGYQTLFDVGYGLTY